MFAISLYVAIGHDWLNTFVEIFIWCFKASIYVSNSFYIKIIGTILYVKFEIKDIS